MRQDCSQRQTSAAVFVVCSPCLCLRQTSSCLSNDREEVAGGGKSLSSEQSTSVWRSSSAADCNVPLAFSSQVPGHGTGRRITQSPHSLPLPALATGSRSGFPLLDSIHSHPAILPLCCRTAHSTPRSTSPAAQSLKRWSAGLSRRCCGLRRRRRRLESRPALTCSALLTDRLPTDHTRHNADRSTVAESSNNFSRPQIPA